MLDPNTTPVPSEILETNDPPAESQIPSIRDFISRARAQKIILNEQIALLQSSLDKTVDNVDKLLAERESLDIQIHKHEGALSPLRRMPIEILSLIFTYTMPPYRRYAESAPWRVSAVCARWRTIALSQPCFWTTIVIDRFRPTDRLSLETQLSRTGNLPLHIAFDCEDVTIFEPEEKQFLDIIVQYSVRWETVALNGPEELYSSIQKHIQRRLPMLRTLTIEMFFQTDFPASDLLDMFACAPNLEAAFVNREMWSCPVTMELPWFQLSRYGASDTWNGHLHALRSCCNLVECTLDIRVDNESTPSGTLTQLPHLLRLSLSHHGFLACLETPSLTELYCHCKVHQDLPLLFRLPRLEKLVIMGGGALPNLAGIVRAVPTIKFLGFLSPLPVDLVRNFLGSGSKLAPALESVAFQLEDDALDDLITPIESSDWEAARLRSITLVSSQWPPSPTILHRTELLRDRGMDITISRDYWGYVSEAFCIEPRRQPGHRPLSPFTLVFLPLRVHADLGFEPTVKFVQIESAGFIQQCRGTWPRTGVSICGIGRFHCVRSLWPTPFWDPIAESCIYVRRDGDGLRGAGVDMAQRKGQRLQRLGAEVVFLAVDQVLRAKGSLQTHIVEHQITGRTTSPEQTSVRLYRGESAPEVEAELGRVRDSTTVSARQLPERSSSRSFCRKNLKRFVGERRSRSRCPRRVAIRVAGSRSPWGRRFKQFVTLKKIRKNSYEATKPSTLRPQGHNYPQNYPQEKVISMLSASRRGEDNPQLQVTITSHFLVTQIVILVTAAGEEPGHDEDVLTTQDHVSVTQTFGVVRDDQ
ncbi:hypothetical protein DFH07DRAFT_774308 [Mycena maculata]|uniref:F-box domain-containing protein n=1 Tax=Mycena maculata TaxID=230809 RepID=A0AAD7NAM1_9AGAR|nr:hypothetical protein DFH07DRAFT_774308 [Mycena maculata]